MMDSAFPGDDRTAHLLRESTRLKESGNVGAALVCLADAKQRMLGARVTYPVETWCKYPRYLLYARQYDAALAELHWLLADIEHRYAREYVDNPSMPGTRAKKLREVKVSVRHSTEVIEKIIARVHAARLKSIGLGVQAAKRKNL